MFTPTPLLTFIHSSRLSSSSESPTCFTMCAFFSAYTLNFSSLSLSHTHREKTKTADCEGLNCLMLPKSDKIPAPPPLLSFSVFLFLFALSKPHTKEWWGGGWWWWWRFLPKTSQSRLHFGKSSDAHNSSHLHRWHWGGDNTSFDTSCQPQYK